MLQICVSSPYEARAAEKMGADRIVLSGFPVSGGITPTPGSITYIKSLVGIPVAAVLRPHAKSYVLSEDDKMVVLEDAAIMRKANVDFIVFGSLDESGIIDLPLLEAVIDKAKGIPLILSRAVDWCQDLPWQVRRLSQYSCIEYIISRGRKSGISPDFAVLKQMRDSAAAASVEKERNAVEIIADLAFPEEKMKLPSDPDTQWFQTAYFCDETGEHSDTDSGRDGE